VGIQKNTRKKLEVGDLTRKADLTGKAL